MKTPRRARDLNVRGNIALAAAFALAGFLTVAVTASGTGWKPLHTWLAVAVAGSGLTALACFVLARRVTVKQSPRGDSPQVTHPPTLPSVTPVEVQK